MALYDLSEHLSRTFTAKDVSYYAAYYQEREWPLAKAAALPWRLDEPTTLKATDVSNIVSRFGKRYKLVRPSSPPRKMRRYTFHQLLYFSVMNMITHEGKSYESALAVINKLADFDFVDEINEGVCYAAVFIETTAFGENLWGIKTFTKARELWAALETDLVYGFRPRKSMDNLGTLSLVFLSKAVKKTLGRLAREASSDERPARKVRRKKK